MNEPVIELTYQQIVEQCNKLAHGFYQIHGNARPDDFKFWEATHPQERLMWQLAVFAYEHIDGTDVEDALNQHLESI